MRALLLAALLPLVKPKIMCSLHLTTNVDGEEVVYKLDYEDTEEGLQHAARQFVEVAKPMLDGCDTTACIIDVIAEHARADVAQPLGRVNCARRRWRDGVGKLLRVRQRRRRCEGRHHFERFCTHGRCADGRVGHAARRAAPILFEATPTDVGGRSSRRHHARGNPGSPAAPAGAPEAPARARWRFRRLFLRGF